MKQQTDEQLMNRVKHGEAEQMAELFERYHVRLYNFFLRLTSNRETSEDLTQNVFYRTLKYRHSFDETASFKTWIYQLARNIHIDHYNQNKPWNDRFVPVETVPEIPSENEGGFENEHYNELEQALKKMPAEQLELIVLSRYQGLKYEDISQIKNCSVGAIKVQMHRAINQLRKFYFQTA